MKTLTTLLLTLLVLGGCSQEPLKLLCYVQDDTFEFEIDTKDSIIIVKRRFSWGAFSSDTFELEVDKDSYATKQHVNERPRYSIDRRTIVLTTANSVQHECKLLELKI